MNDPCHPVESGTRGTVDHVDDAGQLHMRWGNGRSLALVPNEDEFRRLTQEELDQELREQTLEQTMHEQESLFFNLNSPRPFEYRGDLQPALQRLAPGRGRGGVSNTYLTGKDKKP